MTLDDFYQLDLVAQRRILKTLLARERARLRKKQGLPEHEGEWTFARPQEPGYYWIADREGNPRGVRQLVYRMLITGKRMLCEAGIGHNEPGWQGYFWSEPIDQPPAKKDEAS